MTLSGSPRLRPPLILALTKALFLTGRLRKTWDGQQNVGILLPPSVAGALVNMAAMLMGRTVVNLNYTLSEEAIRSCIEQCELLLGLD